MLLGTWIYQVDLEICEVFRFVGGTIGRRRCEVPEVNIVCAEVLECL